MKPKTGKVDSNIYVEKRSGAYRFVVQVSPLPKISATFDGSESGFQSGLLWGRRKRLELQEQKEAAKRSSSEAAAAIQPVRDGEVASIVRATVHASPAAAAIGDILASYREKQLEKLSGSEAAASRLKKLEEWFGHYTLGALTREEIESWLGQRMAGTLGLGRGRIPPPKKVGEPVQTKHQRAALKKAGKHVPKLRYAQVSSQTVRHELVLLRRAIKLYFQDQNVDVKGWVASHPLMGMELPAQAAARSVRLEDDEFQKLKEHFASPMQIAFVLVSIATTLRRSEVCSLCWEDVSFEKLEVFLRAPAHRKKSKTHARYVPLMPAVVNVLKRLGPKKSGPIFEISPSGITQAMRRAADNAGLRDVRLHDLRREGISRLVELFNASLQTVISFSGHSSEDALQRHYIKPRASKVAQQLSAHPAADQLLPAT